MAADPLIRLRLARPLLVLFVLITIAGIGLFIDHVWIARTHATSEKTPIDPVETGSIAESDAIGRAIEKYDR